MQTPRICFLSALAALMAFPAMSKAAEPPPNAPAEIVAAAPQGTHLLVFKASGDQVDANAVAVFETSPDKDGVTYRDLIIVGRKDGKFVPEVSSDKIIACSKCSQFHDDPFAFANLKVTPSHVHLDQMDGGEQPSTTTMDFVRKDATWVVTTATRVSVEEGRYNSRTEKLPKPASGLVKDMDGAWIVPTYFNALAVENKTNRFMFLHGYGTHEELQGSIKSECKGSDCKILVEQQDGCMSLVRDSTARSFAAGTPNAGTKDDAVAFAIAACSRAGGGQCRVVRTDCSTGTRSKIY
ncbi:uncharacterized protein DUF4189 [Luteibacter sp. OK325]|uniref:DUF4189 domain-containing protein n=1 Tax=Luteibacter sp. OK325 TaxID=2135670 RepID=UPI000D3C3130|nr:DUF4189 domain-containing protein [Luteibacter sp. OK325]PTR30930.1 uncharacterized protein DUF4189 [Luteibacter sp. OK325]